jgi:hypothetical protein
VACSLQSDVFWDKLNRTLVTIVHHHMVDPIRIAHTDPIQADLSGEETVINQKGTVVVTVHHEIAQATMIETVRPLTDKMWHEEKTVLLTIDQTWVVRGTDHLSRVVQEIVRPEVVPKRETT